MSTAFKAPEAPLGSDQSWLEWSVKDFQHQVAAFKIDVELAERWGQSSREPLPPTTLPKTT